MLKFSGVAERLVGVHARLSAHGDPAAERPAFDPRAREPGMVRLGAELEATGNGANILLDSPLGRNPQLDAAEERGHRQAGIEDQPRLVDVDPAVPASVEPPRKAEAVLVRSTPSNTATKLYLVAVGVTAGRNRTLHDGGRCPSSRRGSRGRARGAVPRPDHVRPYGIGVSYDGVIEICTDDALLNGIELKPDESLKNCLVPGRLSGNVEPCRRRAPRRLRQRRPRRSGSSSLASSACGR